MNREVTGTFLPTSPARSGAPGPRRFPASCALSRYFFEACASDAACRDVNNLVECYERGPFGNRETYQALTADHPRLRDGFTHFDVDQEICDRWSEKHAGPEETLAVEKTAPLGGDPRLCRISGLLFRFGLF